ncbi:MAG: FtsQ-type POTRA domain-containing protein [Arcicella sp.]|nr:FtsQ-type POTRA domain-containing protein [Arcicella sp.]
MKSLLKFKKWIWFAVLAGISVSLVIFAENIHRLQKCKKINILINGNNENRLTTSQEIYSLIAPNVVESPEGKPFDRINFKKIENSVRTNRLVKNCQVHRDLSGELAVDIEEYTPIARIVSNNKLNSYVTDTGELIGISPHYTVRALLLSGNYFELNHSLKGKKNKPILDLVKAINEDVFWKAQITQLIIEKDGGITLIPEIGNNQIEFGMGIEIDAKFKKLKILYKEILPSKGWDKYKKISVKYRNQIVCE